MTETTATTPEAAPTKKRAAGLGGMLLPELKQMAGGLGIKGAGGMRKSQLIDAIKAAQSGGGSGASSKPADSGSAKADREPRSEDVPAERAESRADRGERGGRNRNQGGNDDQGTQAESRDQDRGQDGGQG